MIRQQSVTFKAQNPVVSNETPGHRPSRHTAEELIERARRHPLGTSFLEKGLLDSVAATFGVHAFTVDRAREILADR